MDSQKTTTTSKNQSPRLSTDERLRVFANLIVDRILEDQKNKVTRVKSPPIE